MDDTTDPPPAGETAPPFPVSRTGEDGQPVHDQEFFLEHDCVMLKHILRWPSSWRIRLV
jgi:hypothetical protein